VIEKTCTPVYAFHDKIAKSGVIETKIATNNAEYFGNNPAKFYLKFSKLTVIS